MPKVLDTLDFVEHEVMDAAMVQELCSISDRTLDKRIAANNAPRFFVRAGSRLFFRSSVLQWMAEGGHKYGGKRG